MTRSTDAGTGEIYVARDGTRSAIELHFAGPAANGRRIIRLTNEEARRLAALILFQAATIEPAHAHQGRTGAESERRSA